jgi:hypothetical protein
MRTILAKISFWTILLIAPSYGEEIGTDEAIGLRLKTLITRLHLREIGRVEIVQIPTYIETRTRITPELLDDAFYYKFVIHDVRGSTYGAGLTSAIQRTTLSASPERYEVRWGISFFDLGDQRAEAIYFSSDGRHGFIGSTAVSMGGGLSSWMARNFSTLFK